MNEFICCYCRNEEGEEVTRDFVVRYDEPLPDANRDNTITHALSEVCLKFYFVVRPGSSSLTDSDFGLRCGLQQAIDIVFEGRCTNALREHLITLSATVQGRVESNC